MAADNGTNTSGLIEELIQDGPDYHVWQAVWLCEILTKRKSGKKGFSF